MISTSQNSFCPICDKKADTLINLENYPLIEIYQKFQENKFDFPVYYNQEFRYCEICDHGFLGKLLPQNFLYNKENYRTCSSASQGAILALNNFYDFIQKKIPKDVSCIIDIGANDTSLLKKFISAESKLIGIDPNITTDDKKIECVKDFFENVDISDISSEKRVFFCSHTFEHIFSPKIFMDILQKKTNVNDIFFFQFPSLNLLIRDFRFDQIHHQHINYFSIKSFKKLIENFGFELISHEFDPDHYGTLMVVFQKKSQDLKFFTYERKYSTNEIKNRYNFFTLNLNSTNERINFKNNDYFYCFGASLMLPILSHYMPNLFNAKKIIDNDKSKKGLSYVNFDIEIVNDLKIDYSKSNFVVTAVATKSVARKIINKLSDLKSMNIVLPLNTI